jgi:hypothetical protein
VDVTLSLTTTSYRIKHVHRTIESVLRQSREPARVILWVSEEPYLKDNGVPQGGLPADLCRLREQGLEIAWTRNTGPYRKLVPSLRRQEGVIVTLDDDTLYPADWLQQLVDLHREHPGCVCCHRGKTMTREADGSLRPYKRWTPYESREPSRDCFPTGKGGVLYPPGCLSDEVLDEDAFMELTPTNDDVWFKAMAMLRGSPACSAGHHRSFSNIPFSHVTGLFISRNVFLNDRYIRNVFDRYGIA